MRQTLKWSGLAVFAALTVMTGLSFNATPAMAARNRQQTMDNGGRLSQYSQQYPDQYSQRSGGSGRGQQAWGRGNSYGSRNGRGQDRGWSNNGCSNSRSGRWNSGGGWNDQGRGQQGHDQRGNGRRQAGGWGGGNRNENQNGNGNRGDNGYRGN